MALDDLRPEDWERVDRELDRLLDLPEADHADALDALGREDPRLREALERILQSEDSPLDRPAVEAAAELVDSETGRRKDPALGTLIGPYRITERLGAGGMGVVYLADRDDEQFRQRVALKLVRGTVGDATAIQRFLAERQILAELDHPNIARLLDGGVSEGGQPYLAMEYVEGVPLAEYCEQGRLDVKARLALFLDVCEAVDAAHRSLVVHRDLKSGNILVDTAGQVKVLDFGIAKWLDAERAGEFGSMTIADIAPFTPECSAPEQLQGGVVTTATDVYGLGVLLYRLLTDKPPFDLEGAALTERVRRLTEETPLPPSEVAPVDRRRAVKGDLDHIVGMAMRKEADRRYASARELREDVKRHLDGHPVTAAPDSGRYRFGKFVRRNAVTVIAGSITVLALLAGLVGATWQANIAAAERVVAERQAEKSARLAESLVRVFEDSNPYGGGSGKVPTALEILDANVDRMRTEFADDPELRAEILLMMARAYKGMGHMEPVEGLLAESQALTDSIFGAGSLESAEVRWSRVGMLRRRGAAAEAAALMPEVLAGFERHLPSDSPDLIPVYETAGHLAKESGDLAVADSIGQMVLELRLLHYGDDDPVLATSYTHQAIILDQLDKDEEAVGLYRKAIDILERHPDQKHNLAATLGNYAILLQGMGELEKAAEAQGASIDLTREIGMESGDVLANHLNTLGSILNDLGRYEESIPVLREAARLNEEAGGRAGIRWIAVSLTLGTALTYSGDLEEARTWLAAGTEGMEALVGTGHLYYGVALSYRAVCDVHAGRNVEGQGDLEKALALLRPALPTRARNTVNVLTYLGELALTGGEDLPASTYLEEGAALARRELPLRDPYRGRALSGLGEFYRSGGRKGEALVFLGEAAEMLESVRGADDPWARTALKRLEQARLLPDR